MLSLNSGSNGNCYYIGNMQDALLVDAGISCRETERRLERVGLDIKRVRAILITHEHGDHIKGVSVLAKKHQLPVYITPKTLAKSGLRLERVRSFSVAEPFGIGDLQVQAVRKYHDAVDPYSFTIQYGALKVGVFTDIGVLCPNVIAHFQQCHGAILEANYDIDMLESGAYPPYLKHRIRGGRGHLSNAQALHLFTQYRPTYMRHLILGHLSAQNNQPEILEQLFKPYAQQAQIEVASRHQESTVMEITAL